MKANITLNSQELKWLAENNCNINIQFDDLGEQKIQINKFDEYNELYDYLSIFEFIKNEDKREENFTFTKGFKSLTYEEAVEIGLADEIERLRYYFYFNFENGETKPVEIEEIEEEDLL